MHHFTSIAKSTARQQLRRNVQMTPRVVVLSPFHHHMNNNNNMLLTRRSYLTENEKSTNNAEKTELEQELELKNGNSTELSLEDQLAAKDKEITELKDRYIRSVADFRNLQETTKREIQKAKDFALQKFARDLIESIDNFGHALNAVDAKTIETNNEIKSLYDGVEMTRNIFVKTLQRYGLQEINPKDEKFDPNRHEAVFEIAQPDMEPGTVFHVQQPGYELNGRVLRAAKVGIVKGEE